MTDKTLEPGTDDVRPVANRREFIRNGVVGVASISIAAMLARQQAGAAELPYSDDYGPVAPVNDLTTGQPLRAMGKSEWEAVAVDPATGIVYQTEDVTPSAFYKFVPNQYGKLHMGGSLWALKVVGTDNFNFSGLNNVYVDFAVGTTWSTEWVQVTDVEAINGRIYNSAPGRAAFARLEGAYYDSGKIYFVSTSGGVARQGQVFCYDPRRETLTMVFNWAGAGVGNNHVNMPDNIAVSPRGGIVLCEDGGNSIQRLRGLTQSGGTFIFGENRMNFTAAQLLQADAALNAVGLPDGRHLRLQHGRDHHARAAAGCVLAARLGACGNGSVSSASRCLTDIIWNGFQP